jgi:hypothetical protein
MKNWGYVKRDQGDYIIMEPPEIGIHVALVHKTSRSDIEIKENAMLIAAAPELLSACQEFFRKVECGEAKSKRSYIQMKEAIKKAGR